MEAVWEITAAIVAIYTVKGLATYGQQVVLSRIANAIVAEIQRRIFDQMLRLKVCYYSKSHSSEFIARQSFIAQSASSVLNLLITTLSRDALTIVGLVIVMVSQDPLLSFFALMFVPLAAIGVRKISTRRARYHGERVPGRHADDGIAAGDSAGHPNRQGVHARGLHARARRGDPGFQAAANKLARVSSRTSPIMESLGGFAIAAVVLYSGYTVIIRGNPPGSMFSFITSVIMLYEPMKRVARLHVDVSTILFGVSMLYEFLDEREFEEDRPACADLGVTRGANRVSRRRCSATGRTRRCFMRVSFVAEAGKTTALVGRSGGGKSTMMSLILRLYESGFGPYPVDGVDIAAVTRDIAAPADRLCRAGEFPVQGLGPRQYRHGPAGRERRRDRRRRKGRVRA